MMEQCGRYWAIRLADLQWTNTHCTTGQRSVTPHTHTLYDGAVRPVLGNQTGRPAVDKHTLYDWTAVSYTTHTHTLYDGQRSVTPQWTNTHCTTGQRSVTPHTHTVRLDSGQLHTHTHCMMEQCGRYWAIRLADLQWTNTHCTTGQRSVTPHTHTLYDWTAVSYTTHTHTV